MKKKLTEDSHILFSVLGQFHPLTEDITQFLSQKLTSKKYRKGSFIIKQGQPCQNIFFIRKGLVRGYIQSGIKTVTTWLSAENEMIASVYGLDNNEPARENIEALEDCLLLTLSITNLQKLYTKHPEFNIIGRKMIQFYYRESEKRASLIRHNNASTKYYYFLHHYPHLANRVPVKYISSFLGIAFETLSRVRKKNSNTRTGQTIA